jgi:hypothetical protein
MTTRADRPDGRQLSTTTAATMVADRVFLLNSAKYNDPPPPFLSTTRSGLAVCGANAHIKIAQMSRTAAVPLIADSGACTRLPLATVDAPVALPDSDGTLFGADINMVLQGQRDGGAAVAFLPTRYVQAGDSKAFKALVAQTWAIERDDVIVAVPVAIAWLKSKQYLPQLIALLNQIPHPKAVMFGQQKNPFDTMTAILNFRRLLAETTSVGLWRADVLAAFDCMAHGGAFAAIGAGGSLRHLVPADEPADGRSGTPSVLLPELLVYTTGKMIADRYANTPAPRCDCPVCGGAALDRFNSKDEEVRVEAHAHNAAAWTGWLGDLLGQNTLDERQRWWRAFCQAALDAQDLESIRLGQANAFKAASSQLKTLAALPQPNTSQ